MKASDASVEEIGRFDVPLNWPHIIRDQHHVGGRILSPVAARKVDNLTVQLGPIMADPTHTGDELAHIALAAVGDHVAPRSGPARYF